LGVEITKKKPKKQQQKNLNKKNYLCLLSIITSHLWLRNVKGRVVHNLNTEGHNVSNGAKMPL